MPTKHLLAAACCAVLISAVPCSGDQSLLGIALKPDPPFAIDGDLGEWNNVPNPIAFTKAEQVVWGPGTWESSEDLSGTAHIAWRQEHLFVAVSVVDDVVS